MSKKSGNTPVAGVQIIEGGDGSQRILMTVDQVRELVGERDRAREKSKEWDLWRMRLAEVFGANGDGGTFEAMQQQVAEHHEHISELRMWRWKSMGWIAGAVAVATLIAGLLSHWIEKHV